MRGCSIITADVFITTDVTTATEDGNGKWRRSQSGEQRNGLPQYLTGSRTAAAK